MSSVLPAFLCCGAIIHNLLVFFVFSFFFFSPLNLIKHLASTYSLAAMQLAFLTTKGYVVA